MPITQREATLDLSWVRSQFPALSQTVDGHPAVFLDGPGGTQAPQRVIDAITHYLSRDNANTGGAYATSRRTDAMIASARAAMADFFHCNPDEVVFGQNMTALTFALSRALGREICVVFFGFSLQLLKTCQLFLRSFRAFQQCLGLLSHLSRRQYLPLACAGGRWRNRQICGYQ